MSSKKKENKDVQFERQLEDISVELPKPNPGETVTKGG